MNVVSNIYRDGLTWCHATWVDGDFASSDPLDIPDAASDEDAESEIRAWFLGLADSHEVSRVADIDTEGERDG